MALKKDIMLPNGIIASYHRIASMSKLTNQLNSILVLSYVNEDIRNRENDIEDNLFIMKDVITKSYDEEETISDVYDYLKTLEKYADAEDV